MKFLVYFCLSLALATTAISRRDRNAMAMATLEKLESLLSEEMALEQAYEQELAEEQAYEQELAEEQAYEQELAEEQAYEQELAKEQAYEQELERQNLIAALQSAYGGGLGTHVQTLSALADLLSTGEVTAQEAMNYIEAQGLDDQIARIEGGKILEILDIALIVTEKFMRITGLLQEDKAKKFDEATIGELKELATMLDGLALKLRALIKTAGSKDAKDFKQEVIDLFAEKLKFFTTKESKLKDAHANPEVLQHYSNCRGSFKTFHGLFESLPDPKLDSLQVQLLLKKLLAL